MSEKEEVRLLKIENAILRVQVRWWQDRARLAQSKAGGFGQYRPPVTFDLKISTLNIVKTLRTTAVKGSLTAQEYAGNMTPELMEFFEFDGKGKLLTPWWTTTQEQEECKS